MTELTLEMLRGWISTGALLGLLTLAGRLWVQNRKLRLQERADDRLGYGTLIETLEKDVRGVREQHAECERRLSMMQGEIDGLRRMFITQSTVAAVALSPTATAAAERTIAAIAKRQEEG